MITRAPIDALPQRTLLGPGPSDVPPRVIQALGAPVVGHLDPAFIEVMEYVKNGLKELYRTENELTFPISGTGSSGMEATLVNVLEPGDKAVVCINGVFGTRMKDIVERCGAKAIVVEAAWGEAIPPEDVETAFRENGPIKLLGIVHAETSTGVLQPLVDISRIAREHGALVLVDAVTSLGGVPVETDIWNLDLVYSGTQKCLSCPPGLAPVTFSARAVEVIENRKTKVASWYLDTTMLTRYWSEERVYHHTAPISMNYALAGAIEVIFDEGLEPRWKRHQTNHKALVAGLTAMGLDMAVKPEIRAPMLNAVTVPDGIDEKRVRQAMLHRMNVEIGAGLGPLAGNVWRIGLMGHSSQPEKVLRCLTALRWALAEQNDHRPDGTMDAIKVLVKAREPS
jgi:alanine-glyoxylate transaminase / serine-glyoxylate transaminase / serine-pyruvate transaminase